jgi:hypothetical protein
MAKTHAEVVDELEANLPIIPYPSNKNPYVIRAWQREALKAGYPSCDHCGKPIVRSHWRTSTIVCSQCIDEDKDPFDMDLADEGEEGVVY